MPFGQISACAAFLVLICAAMIAAPAGGNAQAVTAPASPMASVADDATLDQYRQHLQNLTAIVEACAKARDAKTCDAALVGADDRVPLGTGSNAERRRIRYDWVRALLERAKNKDEAAAKPDVVAQVMPSLASSRPQKRTTTELLEDAKTRLARDLAQTGLPATTLPGHAQERDAMKKVLAQRDFRNLEETSARDTILEQIGNWINDFFAMLAGFGARSSWLGKLVEWGLLGGVCVGLVWGLIQLERRWRIRPVPMQEGPAPGAASARDWQLWLEDARKAAAERRWREAVHFVYWASISRLESKRLWPADRARTPREYLALVAEEDPRKTGLKTLTGNFERIWYGGRAAGEGDYRAAEELAQTLIASGGGAG